MSKSSPESRRFPVFHVPHDGSQFPPELMSSVCVPIQTFLAYHEQMRDKDVQALIPHPFRGPTHLYQFGISRLLCDVERFIGPDEVMERYGMGFCYEKAFDGTIIKHVTDALKRLTLPYYQSHHERMDGLVRVHPSLLLIDLHSYSDLILPGRSAAKMDRTPDLCIGTDPAFTPPELIDAAISLFSRSGFTVALDQPYSGTFVPSRLMKHRSGSDCMSIMLEFNRRAYLTDTGDIDPRRVSIIQDCVRGVVNASLSIP